MKEVYNVPGIRDDHVRTMNSFPRVCRPENVLVAFQLSDAPPHLGWRAVLLGRGDAELVPEPRVRDKHIMQHVGGVTDICDRERAQLPEL